MSEKKMKNRQHRVGTLATKVGLYQVYGTLEERHQAQKAKSEHIPYVSPRRPNVMGIELMDRMRDRKESTC